MAQIPLDAGTAGKAPIVAAAIPRMHHRVLRELAAARGLTVSGLLRVLIAQGLDGMSQEADHDHDGSTQKTRKGGSRSAAPGLLNAGTRQQHQLGSDDRTPTCPTIRNTITAVTDT